MHGNKGISSWTSRQVDQVAWELGVSVHVCLFACQSVSEGNAPGGTRRPRPTVRRSMELGRLTETHYCAQGGSVPAAGPGLWALGTHMPKYQ